MVQCPDCGPFRLDPASQRSWQLDDEWLIRKLRGALDIAPQASITCIADGVWDRRPPVFSSTGLWSPGGNLTGFESAFGHKPLGSVRPGISWVAPRCIPGAKLRRLRGHAPCW